MTLAQQLSWGGRHGWDMGPSSLVDEVDCSFWAGRLRHCSRWRLIAETSHKSVNVFNCVSLYEDGGQDVQQSNFSSPLLFLSPSLPPHFYLFLFVKKIEVEKWNIPVRKSFVDTVKYKIKTHSLQKTNKQNLWPSPLHSEIGHRTLTFLSGLFGLCRVIIIVGMFLMEYLMPKPLSLGGT